MPEASPDPVPDPAADPATAPLAALLARHVEAGTVPGAVAVHGGRGARPLAAGVAEVGGAPLRTDAVFRVQSMTKAVLAVATLRLVERGALGLDDPVAGWLPELADLRVLRSPGADLDDTVPLARPVTVRHLLTCTSGWGVAVTDSPLARQMERDGTAAGQEPPALAAPEWLARLAGLPLAFQPGEGWRYHHSYQVLGLLLGRCTGGDLGAHLADDLLSPLGMHDTGYRVDGPDRARLPAAYRRTGDGLVEVEPAGSLAVPPGDDVGHGELVSSVGDYARFARLLADDGVLDGERFLAAEHVRAMTSDQVPDAVKTPDSFLPGFWEGTGWGFGVAVRDAGPHAGRFGWSGGLGTDFFVDPDGTVAVLATQVEIDGRVAALFEDLQDLPTPAGPTGPAGSGG
ncbi:serine hydrolase domain-containing protein [Aquipuribacter sp. SD81]|uniref:serine hydrolase domain-containing protein n=1 Tax=Aquipuribacter sp. SD81 TaxID=3127703 RepID=UPI00301A1308